MKKLNFFILITFVFISISYGQLDQKNQFNFYQEMRDKVEKADRSDFHYVPKKPGHYTAEDWKAVIDSTWGEGMPTAKKLELFDYCWNLIDREYPSFYNIDVDWDSLRTIYRPEVAAGVSRGRFYAIMSHMFKNLLDSHSLVLDWAIVTDSLKPGTPLMVVYGIPTMINKVYLEREYSHFGGGLAPLSDSSLFVYDVVENHPLGLERGDVILGYDNIPWKILYKELLRAELPLYGPASMTSNTSSDLYNLLTAAGENWHLFDTIDIVKYTTGDTIHLQTSLLHNQNIYKLNSDQMPIPGVSFPDIDGGHFVSWGVVEGTQTGYIYVWSWSKNSSFSYPTVNTGDEFKQAVFDLVNNHQVDGLIIDSRLNLGGQLSEYTKALSVLNSEDQNFYMDFIRDNPADHYSMKISPYGELFNVEADNNLFDKPIAVLTGPNSKSSGDLMPLQMRLHPMTRTFGLSTNGAFGIVENPNISSISDDWYFQKTLTNISLTEQPDEFLTHLNIPPDEEIWLTQEDAANGKDAVVNRALEWIQNLAYTHDVTVNKTYAKPGVDTVIITAHVENPNQHEIAVTAGIHNFDGVFIASLSLFDDGMHGDDMVGDGLWGNFYMPLEEQSYTISVETKDVGDGLRDNFFIPLEEQSNTISVETKVNTTETSRILTKAIRSPALK